jgi:hypothetical protein
VHISEVVINGVEPSDYFSNRFPDWLHVDSGICFDVFEDINTQQIFKLQSIACKHEQIKEINYWTQYCIDHQYSRYLPYFNSCVKYTFKNKRLMCIDSEKLVAVDSNVANDIKYIFKGYIATAFTDLSDTDVNVILSRIHESKYFLACVGSDFDSFFTVLLADLKKISRKQGDTVFSLDFHFNNFMIRPSTGELVIIDAFSCSMYNE